MYLLYRRKGGSAREATGGVDSGEEQSSSEWEFSVEIGEREISQRIGGSQGCLFINISLLPIDLIHMEILY